MLWLDICRSLDKRWSDKSQVRQKSGQTKVRSDKSQVRQKSGRTNVRSDKCPVGQTLVRQMSVPQTLDRQTSVKQNCGWTKVRLTNVRSDKRCSDKCHVGQKSGRTNIGRTNIGRTKVAAPAWHYNRFDINFSRHYSTNYTFYHNSLLIYKNWSRCDLPQFFFRQFLKHPHSSCQTESVLNCRRKNCLTSHLHLQELLGQFSSTVEQNLCHLQIRKMDEKNSFIIYI